MRSLLSWLSLTGAIALLSAHNTHGQVPDWAWAHDAAADKAASWAIARYADSSYSVVGSFEQAITLGRNTLTSSGSDDIFVAHYSAQGQAGWAVQAGGAGSDGATATATDAAGNLFVTGHFQATASFGATVLTSAAYGDVFLAKYSPAGALQWVRQGRGPHDDAGKALAVDSSGNVWVAGNFKDRLTFGATGLTAAGDATFLVKFDGQGNELWAAALAQSYVGGAAADRAGHVYLAGSFTAEGRLLAKYDGTSGALLWTSPPAGRGAHAGNALAIGREGELYVAGSFQDTLRLGAAQLLGPGAGNGFLARFSAQGAATWAQSIGGPGADQCYGVALSPAGTVAVTGYFQDSMSLGGCQLQGGSKCSCIGMFVAAYTGQGTCLWARNFTSSALSCGTGLAFDKADELTVTGVYQGEATVGNQVLSYGCGGTLFVAHLTTAFPDLVVSSAQSVQGSYHNVTVTGTGAATLTGALQVTGTLAVQGGGLLATQCQPITGPGSFALGAGAELRICHPAGIAATGPVGAVQVSGPRAYSTAADYVYNGAVAQQTGPGLPSEVRLLAVDNAAGLGLTNALSITLGVRLSKGNLHLNGRMLTLLSSAGHTAWVDNAGGLVQGQATVQRYIAPAQNAGPGYRHFSTPVLGSTVADLATPSFTPVTNPACNTSANPGAVRPYPTVFGYDEQWIATRPTTALSNFDKGWVSPASNGEALEVMRGYSVNIAAAQTVDFVGSLVTGPQSRTLTRGTQTDAGWNLLGNPYPSTLDWSLVSVPAGVDNAVHVYQSTGPYAGQYRSYINGMGNPLLASGQAFMVHLSSPGTSVSLTLTNAARRTETGATPTFSRGAPVDTRPLLSLSLREMGTGAADEVSLYFEAGATAAFDARYDARKPRPDSTGRIQLSSLAFSGEELSINGLPALARSVEVPLALTGAGPGDYAFQLEKLVNGAALNVYLLDAATRSSICLNRRSAYSFTISAGEKLNGRFSLRFESLGLASVPAGR